MSVKDNNSPINLVTSTTQTVKYKIPLRYFILFISSLCLNAYFIYTLSMIGPNCKNHFFWHLIHPVKSFSLNFLQ